MSDPARDRIHEGKEKLHNSWKEEYRAKLCNAEQAAALVGSGETVYLGGGTGIPAAFANALGKRSSQINDITIYQGYAMALYEYMKPEHRDSFHIETMFVGPMERVCMEWGVAQYVPVHLSDLGKMAMTVDFDKVAFIATPPDENGYMNRSCFGSFLPHAECLMRGDTRIVEINSHAPWLISEDFKIHISEVDHIIENDNPLFVLPEIAITDVERKMAEHIAELIPDGSCIQLGFGGLSNAIGHLLMHKKDLGMHAEVVTPSVMELVKAGVLNGSRKSFMPGKVVTAFAVGTEEFYRYLDRNDSFFFREVGWVNNPDNIALNDNLVSVNNAMMVDLTGQLASESVGTRQYSGTGGQLNFVLGARRSHNGKSIMALQSTYADREGKMRSKIVPYFPAGTAVTTPRAETEYVATEWGVVNLRFESTHKRVKKLISIAHPDFRDELTFEARKMKLL